MLGFMQIFDHLMKPKNSITIPKILYNIPVDIIASLLSILYFLSRFILNAVAKIYSRPKLFIASLW